MLPPDALSASSAIATIQDLLQPRPRPCPWTQSEIEAMTASLARRMATGDTSAKVELDLWLSTLIGTEWGLLPAALDRLQDTPIESLPPAVHEALIEQVWGDTAAAATLEDALGGYSLALHQGNDGGSY